MLNILITSPIVILMVFVLLWGARRDSSGSFFFSKDFTTVLKGLAAIVVVFVHFPQSMQNPLQDAIGSFAYVAVTIFFMISAYGMLFGAVKKTGPDNCEIRLNGKRYWTNRLSSLIIPNILINIVFVAIGLALLSYTPTKALSMLNLNGYVWVLLQYCLLFFICMWACKKFNIKLSVICIIMACIVALSGLLIYLLSPTDVNSSELQWCFERYGLIWGIGLFMMFGTIRNFLSKKTIVKCAIFVILSGILGVAYLKYKAVWFVGQFALKIVLGLVMIITLFLATYKLRLCNKAALFLGNISYEIYLSHGFVAGLVSHYLPGYPGGMCILTVFAVTILFSAAIHPLSSRLVSLVRQK